MARAENYGVIMIVREQVATELADEIMDIKTRVGLLQFGHDRWTHIDAILKHNMGRNVREWWVAQSMVYKSMVRRRIWERALGLVQEKVAGMKASSRKRSSRSTTVESLLTLLEERH